MAIYKAQISFQADTNLPRDMVTITPHFFGDNAQALADALKTNFTNLSGVGVTVPFTIKIYDAQKLPPNYALATATNVGTTPKASSFPREIALCLSYYSTWNRPRFPGRLYIPGCFITGAAGIRPTGAQMTQALTWANSLKTGLPSGHNWVVYSKVDNKSNGVSNYWVDDEWDIQRSRGTRSTTRQLGTVP